MGDVKQAVRDVYDDAVAAGTYISQKVKEAKESVRRFACETAERIGSFVEEHANVFKVIAGVAIIAGLGVATVLTGGLAGIAGAALIGAIIGGGSGAIVGGAMSALSGGSFWDGAADGFLWGVIGGALGGGVGGMLSGPAAGTAGTASTVAGGVFGRGVVDTIVDTGVDMARMTLTGGITLSGFVDSIASNALMEFGTAGTAPPGSARTVKNAVDNALDSGDTQALRAAEGSAGILRSGLRRMLTGHRHVKKTRSGGPDEGGDGATVVTIK